jgi:hypothetical protein
MSRPILIFTAESPKDVEDQIANYEANNPDFAKLYYLGSSVCTQQKMTDALQYTITFVHSNYAAR